MNENANKPVLKPILRKRRSKRHSRMGAGLNETESSGKSPDTSKKKRFSAGPIRVIILEPKSEYCKNVWNAILVGLAYVAIGAVNMTVFHYSVAIGDAHAVLCCLAFHFFAAEAILALHYANSWSTPMRSKHRKFSHFFLHVCGVVCVIAGTVLVTMSKGISLDLHGISGILTVALFLLNIVIGPITFWDNGRRAWLFNLHLTFGVIAFILSSVCVCSAIALDSFYDWAKDSVVYILIGFVIFYTVIIVTHSFMNCISRM